MAMPVFRKVIAEQLRHLAELALLPTVDVQVIALDTLSYVPLGYDFTVLRFDHDTATDIVYIELYDDGVWTAGLEVDTAPEIVGR